MRRDHVASMLIRCQFGIVCLLGPLSSVQIAKVKSAGMAMMTAHLLCPSCILHLNEITQEGLQA